MEQQFLELYEESADAVFRHCYFRVHDRERALDIAEEAFARTWAELARGAQIENAKAFVYRVANNLIIDHYRKKKEASLEVLAETGFDPSGDDHLDIERSAAGKEAIRAIEQLDDEAHRQVMVLRFVNDLSIEEIAEIRNESKNAVSVRIHRALKKLKDILEHGTI